MKTPRCLVLATLVSTVAMTGALADPSGADNGRSGVPVDQDGIPLSVTGPQQKEPTPEEIEAYQKIQAKSELDKDWLLRAYEKQRQLHVGANPSDTSNDLYYRLISNKDLAGLAGLTALESSSRDRAAGSAPGAAQGTPTKPAGSSTTAGAASPHATYKPLITPLGSAGAAGLHSFYSTLQPTASPSLLPEANSPKISPAPETQEDQDPSAIETPGLIAAENDPLMDKASSNLTLDLAARDPLEHTTSPEDNSPAKLELPLPTNAALLRKAQESALNVPGMVKPAPVTPVHAPLLPDPNEPTPISKMPQSNPVRSPIADPRDIFYR